eukprot:scaffold201908_cov25-Prasinocladus_malaysianus.AAC.1
MHQSHTHQMQHMAPPRPEAVAFVARVPPPKPGMSIAMQAELVRRVRDDLTKLEVRPPTHQPLFLYWLCGIY